MSPAATDEPQINYQVTGAGSPITCFVPGLAQTISETRLFGSGVRGSRVFLELRGQGGYTAPATDDVDSWTYRELADDVQSVVGTTKATRALGVSLGAGVLLDLAIRKPQLFDRLVLALPASIDQPRAAPGIALADLLAEAVDANDQVALARLLVELQPVSARRRPDVGLWARRRAAEIGGTPVSRVLRTLPRLIPVPDRERLRSIEIPVLVLGQRDDPSHPTDVAEQLGSLLSNAQVLISDDSWVWSGRSHLRAAVAGFLND